jgi:isochorismate hydrolase
VSRYQSRTVERWKRAIAPYCRPAPRAVASRSALLVVDMQRYFEAMCEPIAATVRKTVDGCRALGVPVLFTQMDATATADEQMHVASLVNMAYGFAHVQTAGQWLSSMETGKKRT